ncbi:MAG: YCF48-related protein [Thermoanaerobaculia bacterium]|nr:YCF48-related protein [Thermoanaerobaculia bacterium]
MKLKMSLVVVLLLSLSAAADPSDSTAAWTVFDTGSKASLRGLYAVSEKVVWASGTAGTVLRTVDGGETWQKLAVAGAEELDFRDVQAFDADRALLLTAGQPARIYRTTDGGATFQQVHESAHETAFFDGMAFWDEQRGVAFSDPVDGKFLILTTSDGGSSWQRADPAKLPPAHEGEAGFAASGTNVATGPDGHAWIGTGGTVARVLVSDDFGATWRAVTSPLAQGEGSTGIFSVAFRDAQHGVAIGGDYRKPEDTTGNVAFSEDGGNTWHAVTDAPPTGHRACVTHLGGHSPTSWLAVGRAGTDLSVDDGASWSRLGDVGFYACSVANDGSIWTAGSDGRVARLVLENRSQR